MTVPFTKAWRRRVMLTDMAIEQHWGCFYCQVRMLSPDVVPDGHRLRATFDHVKAESRGGGFWRGNLVVACWECNNRKGSLDLDSEEAVTFYRWVAQKMRRRLHGALPAALTDLVASRDREPAFD